MLKKTKSFKCFALAFCYCVAFSSFGQSVDETELLREVSLSLKEALRNKNKSRALYLSDSTLTVFPPKVLELKNLEWLHISGSKISTVPDEISALKKLQFLYLTRNVNLDIESVLKSIKNTNISRLGLTHCRLTELPGTIGEIGKLNELYLYNNQLKSLPQQIGSLQNLEVLLLERNLLTDLPSTMENLTRLKVLTLSGNLFHQLPEVISKLPSLSDIYVGQEQMDIEQMFEVLGNSHSLRSIHVSQINLADGKNIEQLVKINKLEQIILEDVFVSFEEIPLDLLSRFHFKVIIKTSLDLTEDQLGKIHSFQNIDLIEYNNWY